MTRVGSVSSTSDDSFQGYDVESVSTTTFYNTTPWVFPRAPMPSGGSVSSTSNDLSDGNDSVLTPILKRNKGITCFKLHVGNYVAITNHYGGNYNKTGYITRMTKKMVVVQDGKGYTYNKMKRNVKRTRSPD